MFRKTAYSSVGGYRKQFYYGQDWDLWYRFAEIGNFFIVPEVLYRARIFPESISMTSKHCQDASAECSKCAFIARRRNESEKPWIEKAASIHPDNLAPLKKKDQNYNKEPGFYFIGEALRRNGDHRCRPYFLAAIRQDPLRVRSYLRLFQSLI
jgi:ribosomal protein L24